MFEQASIESPGLLKRPWAMTISLAGQVAALGAAVLVSLIQTDSLPRASFLSGLVAPGPPARNPTPPARTVAVRSSKTSPHAFVAPTMIPQSISTDAPDAPALSPYDGPVNTGVPGGIELQPGHVLPIILEPAHPNPPTAPARAKPVEPAPKQLVRVSIGVQAAKLVRQVNPVYPPLARQARIAGTVRLTAIIGRDGAIENLQVSSGHPLLTPAALEAVKQWRYQPTLLNGEAVEVITQIDVNFTLSR
jgi:periplasmic protein TonB